MKNQASWLMRLRLGLQVLVISVIQLMLVNCSKPIPSNVLIISLDTTRVDRLDAYGFRKPTAPALTSLLDHSQAIRFDRAYSPSPWTLPAHASLMSGLLPQVHGATFRGDDSLGDDSLGDGGSETSDSPLIARFPSEIETLSKRLLASGFSTGAFVSGPLLRHEFGLSEGFNEYDDELDYGENSSDEKRIGEYTVDRALAWMDSHRDEPKFTFVHLFDAHTPYVLPKSYAREHLDLGTYNRSIRYMSDQIEKIFAKLKEMGEWDSTLIVIVSDHGESFSDEHPTGTENGHAKTLYEEVVRVAMILRLPGSDVEKAGNDTLVSLVDVAPTVLDVLELEPLEGQGRSLKPLFAGETIEETPWIGYLGLNRSVPMQGTRYHRSLEGYRKGPWKLITSTRKEEDLLFDLEKDPLEKVNRVFSEPDRYRSMKSALLTEVGGLPPMSAAVKPEFDEAVLESLRKLGYLK